MALSNQATKYSPVRFEWMECVVGVTIRGKLFPKKKKMVIVSFFKM